MDENKELLLYIYENVDMGVKSCTKLINILNNKDNKIKTVVEDILKGYEGYLKDAKKLMKKYKVDEKTKGIMSDIMSSVGMNYEMLKDNSDSRVADMLIKGFTMGNIDIDKKIEKYNKRVEKDIYSLSLKIKGFGEKSIDGLKKYI